MTDVQKTSGGAPSSLLLVSTDGVTITGDGSLSNILRAIAALASLPVVVLPSPPVNGTTALHAGKTSVTNIVAGGNQVFDLPLASSVPNGTELVAVFLNAQAGSTLSITPVDGDVLHSFNGGLSSFVFPQGYGAATYVSDGVSAWWEI
jgi:hypothetical protein